MTRPSGSGAGPRPKPLFDVLYTYVIFGALLLYVMSIASVFVLRVRRPGLPRPYRTWGYPLTPALYILSSLALIGDMLRTSPFESMAGLGLILLGIPVFASFSREDRERPPDDLAEPA